MLGYITEEKAKAEGFTHHGSYYGIPIWMGNVEAEDAGPVIAAKWAPLELVMRLFHHIEAICQSIAGHEQRGFWFNVKKEIT